MAVSVQTYEREIWNLSTEIALIRFSFRHLRRHPHIRAEFINERAEQILNGWRQFARAEPEEFCGYENVLVPTFAKKETDWLRANLEAVIEFSMARARFALSEFPRRLIVAAAQEYPEACTTDPSDGQSERPGYAIRKVLKSL